MAETYLNLGGNTVVFVGEVVAILDGRVAGSEVNKEFLRRAGQDSETKVPKSWVVTKDGVVPSGLSPAALARRMAGFSNGARSWRA